MRFMTSRALCCLAMSQMTFVAIQSRMFTRLGLHFTPLIRVTCETNNPGIAELREIHFQRIMRMVAGAAFFKSIMNCFISAMTRLAFRNALVSVDYVTFFTVKRSMLTRVCL